MSKRRNALWTCLAWTVLAGLAGCGTAEKTETALHADGGGPQVPDWVVDPEVKGGMAATECTRASGELSLDKAEAVALARANLAKQIRVKIQAMDKAYRRQVQARGGTVAGGTFESVSRQVTETYLMGSEIRKLRYVVLGEDGQYLCAMVGMDPERLKGLFTDLLEASGKHLEPAREAALYEEFRARQAQRELDRELAGD
ncbi:hypothetical protein [Thiohalorhabdus methylotrophus]|uniref:LPP20 lipoprotein n=1 Tax=Thiohalorhabdus methylotrophus TaxID=3242694 RepID=A0ABV4TY42_9GAMM